MNILYLSDIHLGREYIARGKFEKRETIQQQLIDTVAELPQNMKPHYVVVTGDIAWTGNEWEYEKAYQWFKKLLDSLGLTGSQVAFCAGNHDVNRKNMTKISLEELKNGSELNIKKIDEQYRYENISNYDVQILAFNDFCNRLNVLPYWYEVPGEVSESDKFGFGNKRYSYTAGTKDIRFGDECYRFVGFHTAMFSGYSTLPDDENFLGLPQVEELITTGKIGEAAMRQNYIIALFHHAERFLNTNEMNSYNDRSATLYKLMENVNLALCGHTETGAIPTLRKQNEGGVLLNGGAAYYSDDHPNSFSILHIEPKNGKIENCTFVYKKEKWIPHRDIQSFDWQLSTAKVQTIDAAGKKNSYTLRLKAGEHLKEIPANIMDDGLYINGSQMYRYFTNYRDVNRLFDIIGDESGLHINIAAGRERMVKAMYEKLDIAYFLEKYTDGRNAQGKFELLTESGTTLMAGTLPHMVLNETEKGLYCLFRKLKRLEDAFHVCFFVPDSITTEDRITVKSLENLLEDGGTVHEDKSEDKLVYFSSDVKIFRRIIELLETESTGRKTISLSYRVPLQCHLMGAVIPLGMCRVIAVNLLPDDKETLIKQRDTFIEGDRRRLTLRWVNNIVQFAIIQEDNSKKKQDILEMEKRLEQGTFVFEIEPQNFCFGNNKTKFQPDNKEVEKRNIKLAETMSQFRQSMRLIR